MKRSLVNLLRCPTTKEPFEIHSFFEKDEEIIEGILITTSRDTWYPITKGVPRLLPAGLFNRVHFMKQFSEKLNNIGVSNNENYSDKLISLKKHTIKNFSYEWRKYSRFGWDDCVFNIERERRIFLKKSCLSPKDLQGKLVLDAGCGNGRYSFWAAEFGGEIIGIDIGDSVEIAFNNTRSKNVHIIQGDLFNPPFSEGTFDIIFSIGVLMHTGNPKQITRILADYLVPGGRLTIHVYGKGNPIFEFNDRLLRFFTTKMDISNLVSFTRLMTYFASVLRKMHTLKYMNAFIRLETHPHCIFDWYSAPIATHHTESEVVSWFKECDLKIIKVESVYTDSWNKKLGNLLGTTSFFAGSTVRVQGGKKLI